MHRRLARSAVVRSRQDASPWSAPSSSPCASRKERARNRRPIRRAESDHDGSAILRGGMIRGQPNDALRATVSVVEAFELQFEAGIERRLYLSFDRHQRSAERGAMVLFMRRNDNAHAVFDLHD